MDSTLAVADGRTVGFVDYGPPAGAAVLWCHGGPGSRLEPMFVEQRAADEGFRLIGIDRPGYGLSQPQPGRTIADWVPDAIAVADALDLERFYAVGVSTGGAYALALAAIAPSRVLGVVACCAVTDMRWPEGRATMSAPHTHALWDAPDREHALAAALEAHGADGAKLLQAANDGPQLAPSDLALFANQGWLAAAIRGMPEMFAFGQEGYVDDRLADGPGWGSFSVDAITCPVIVLHGGSDIIVDPAHARHTAEVVPNAQVRVVDALGHFSIVGEIVPALVEMREQSS